MPGASGARLSNPSIGNDDFDSCSSVAGGETGADVLMLHLYIDPGKFHAGAALFERSLLVKADVLFTKTQNPAQACKELADEALRMVGAQKVDKIACERPSVWTQGGGRGNPNHLLDLMATNGAIFDAVPADWRTYITTNDWKGQVPKSVMEIRIRKRLGEEETRVLGLVSDHNAIDAVGIGLWDLGRL